MSRGGATAASAARALRSRLVLDLSHHPATSLAPIPLARTSSSSAPSTSAANIIVEEAVAAAVSISQQTGSISDVLQHYGKCYWELSKARLSALVVATSGAGYVLGSGNIVDIAGLCSGAGSVLGSGNIVDIAGLCCTCAGTMMVAASANTLNQIYISCFLTCQINGSVRLVLKAAVADADADADFCERKTLLNGWLILAFVGSRTEFLR